MKKIKYIFAHIMVLLSLSACTTADDNIKQPNNTSGRVFGLASPDVEGFALTEGGVQSRIISDTLNFRDLSTLSNGRAWTFPADVVNIIGSSNNVTSNEEQLRAVFTKPGDYVVQLKSTFDGPVNEDTLDFKFSVLDSIFITSAKANGTDLIPEGLTFEAGQEVNFTSATTGNPVSSVWTFQKKGANTSQITRFSNVDETNLVFSFQEVGEFDYTFEASSSRPFGNAKREGVITVTLPTEPFVLTNAIELENGSIQLLANRNIANLPSSIASDFDIKVNGTSVAISDISIDETISNALIINTSVNITTNDITEITYTPGDLKDVFGASAEAFAGEVAPFQIDFFDKTFFDFDENELILNQSTNIFFFPDLPSESVLQMVNSALPTGENVSERSVSLSIGTPSNVNYIIFPREPNVATIGPGRYMLRFFAKSTSTDLSLIFFNGDSENFTPLVPGINIDSSDWQMYTREFTVASGVNVPTIELGFDNTGAPNANPYEVQINGLQLLSLD